MPRVRTQRLLGDAVVEAAVLAEVDRMLSPIARVAGCDTGWTAPTCWLEGWVYPDRLWVIDSAIIARRTTIADVLDRVRGDRPPRPQLVGLGPDGRATRETCGYSVADVLESRGYGTACFRMSASDKVDLLRRAVTSVGRGLRVRWSLSCVELSSWLVATVVEGAGDHVRLRCPYDAPHVLDALVYGMLSAERAIILATLEAHRARVASEGRN